MKSNFFLVESFYLDDNGDLLYGTGYVNKIIKSANPVNPESEEKISIIADSIQKMEKYANLNDEKNLRKSYDDFISAIKSELSLSDREVVKFIIDARNRARREMFLVPDNEMSDIRLSIKIMNDKLENLGALDESLLDHSKTYESGPFSLDRDGNLAVGKKPVAYRPVDRTESSIKTQKDNDTTKQTPTQNNNRNEDTVYPKVNPAQWSKVNKSFLGIKSIEFLGQVKENGLYWNDMYITYTTGKKLYASVPIKGEFVDLISSKNSKQLADYLEKKFG